jgi:hypothetical protein
MKSNIVLAFTNLRKSKVFFEDFKTECGPGNASRLVLPYIKKLEFIELDFRSKSFFSKDILNAIDLELKSDPFEMDAIAEKSSLLNTTQRQIIEQIIDGMLNGEEINIVG